MKRKAKQAAAEAWQVWMANPCSPPEGYPHISDEKPEMEVGETIYKGSIDEETCVRIVHLVEHECSEKCGGSTK